MPNVPLTLPKISVVICSHNPKEIYLERTFRSLEAQTLDRSEWELLLVDNNSREPLSGRWDLSWHVAGRHVREELPGLTPARIRGIAESAGDLLVFVDDDNVLSPDYLERANRLYLTQARLGAFGSGAIEPEFEVPPPRTLQSRLSLLALRTVPGPQLASTRTETHSIPWGAGLCVRRTVAAAYAEVVKQLNMGALDRCGNRLFCGGDDLFSFVASDAGLSFGIFPELRVTHLIAPDRLTEQYFIRLIHDHAYSHAILKYLLFGASDVGRRSSSLRTLLHGVRRGLFSMRCRVAALRGAEAAREVIQEQRLRPIQRGSGLTSDE